MLQMWDVTYCEQYILKISIIIDNTEIDHSYYITRFITKTKITNYDNIIRIFVHMGKSSKPELHPKLFFKKFKHSI